jgi:cell division protease FtsH
LERIALALLEREVLDGSEVRQLIEGIEPLPPFHRTPPATPPSDGSQQIIKPEPGRRMPGMLPEGGPQPA